jgi:SPP1 family phage portal protein
MILSGRKQIKPEPIVGFEGDDLILAILDNTMADINANWGQIKYLDGYYRGIQPIWNRIKEVRPEICNKIVENRAHEIVQFYVSYRASYPTVFVATRIDVDSEAISDFNQYMDVISMQAVEAELVEWQEICGTAFAFVYPTVDGVKVGVLNPATTFVIYSNDIVPVPIIAGVRTKEKLCVYTDLFYYEIEEGTITYKTENAIGKIPIVEFPLNRARTGRFEPVVPLLDAVNLLDSNRLDGVEQLVQSFLKFINCDITLEEYEEFKKQGVIKIKTTGKNKADLEYVSVVLDQSQTQQLKQDYLSSIISITGIPNRNGGSSTSDTGAAVEMRDGWQTANFNAKQAEIRFAQSERKMIEVIMAISHQLGQFEKLNAVDITMQYSRRNYDNLQTKSQVLTGMLASDKIHPLLAFRHCGMFPDPDEAYKMSEEYMRENSQNAKEQGENLTNAKE